MGIGAECDLNRQLSYFALGMNYEPYIAAQESFIWKIIWYQRSDKRAYILAQSSMIMCLCICDLF